ncbi:MAG: asparagine synthase-related protein [Candidatus Methanomethylicaceae archaeon]
MRAYEKPKQFFMVPERRWLTRDLAPLFWDLYRSQTIQSLGIFKPGAVEQVWSEMLADVPGASKQVWALLSFMVWYQLYLHSLQFAPILKREVLELL